MKSEAVSLPVIAGVPLDCSFWHKRWWLERCLREVVGHSSCSGFEDAKKNMETALQEQVERILREYLGPSARRIA